ncbi:MAG: hypothetical protein ACHQUC_03105 [Chlamydiales bacterium]
MAQKVITKELIDSLKGKIPNIVALEAWLGSTIEEIFHSISIAKTPSRETISRLFIPKEVVRGTLHYTRTHSNPKHYNPHRKQFYDDYPELTEELQDSQIVVDFKSIVRYKRMERNFDYAHLWPTITEVIGYLEGSKELDHLGLTEGNALSFLKRIGKIAKQFMGLELVSRLLCRLMNRVLLMMRGNTGVGKSFTIRRFVGDFLDYDQSIDHGVLNTDLYKGFLRESEEKPVLNHQVHLEARSWLERFVEAWKRGRNQVAGGIIDTRLLEIGDLHDSIKLAHFLGVA